MEKGLARRTTESDAMSYIIWVVVTPFVVGVSAGIMIFWLAGVI